MFFTRWPSEEHILHIMFFTRWFLCVVQKRLQFTSKLKMTKKLSSRTRVYPWVRNGLFPPGGNATVSSAQSSPQALGGMTRRIGSPRTSGADGGRSSFEFLLDDILRARELSFHKLISALSLKHTRTFRENEYNVFAGRRLGGGVQRDTKRWRLSLQPSWPFCRRQHCDKSLGSTGGVDEGQRSDGGNGYPDLQMWCGC